MTGGFSFGSTSGGGTSAFSFGATPTQGTTQAAATQANFSFGASAAPKTTGLGASFNFGGGTSQPAQTTAPASSSFGFGQTATQNSQQNASFSQGLLSTQPAVTTQSTGLHFGTPQTTSGFSLGGQSQASSTPASGISFSGASAATSQPGTTLQLGTPALSNTISTTSKPTGVTFSTPLVTSSAGLSLLGTPAVGAVTSSTGGALGGTATSTLGVSSGFTSASSVFAPAVSTVTTTSATGLTLGGTSTATGSFGGFGGLLSSSNTATSSATATGIFATPASTVSSGLGGLDPQTMSYSTGSSVSTGKPGENKAVKETNVPNEINVTVEDFKKYVKNQKTVRENIARMSSTPLFKVQEEVINLKQLLSLVSNGLQRNSVTIEKLKQESAQELKYAEIAQRTKETPPGLQYEHTAPTEYFQRLVDGFESQMMFYRQQIEEMENHLNSLNSRSTLTPLEMSQILARLHETFIGMAGHLQFIHESVKAQKDQFLTYRRIISGDHTDVFEKRRKAKQVTGSSITACSGPTPFANLSNAAAVALATAMDQRNQQPMGLGMNTTGFASGQNTGLGNNPVAGSLMGTNTGFGGSTGFNNNPTTSQSIGFGTGFNFGNATNTAAVRPLG